MTDETPTPLEEKLARVSFQRGPEPHIVLDQALCADCSIHHACTTCCPAGNYRLEERSGQMIVSTESCMECGTCRIVCTEGAVSWRWPQGGFGVCYRNG